MILEGRSDSKSHSIHNETTAGISIFIRVLVSQHFPFLTSEAVPHFVACIDLELMILQQTQLQNAFIAIFKYKSFPCSQLNTPKHQSPAIAA